MMGLRYDEVADLIKIIDSSACDELVLETSDLKLVVRRRGSNSEPAASASPQNARDIAAPISAPTQTPSPQALPSQNPTVRPVQTTDVGQIEIRAPMVGTFYRAPSPEAPPFVEVGAWVEIGQPICVIEVMKLFTTLYAEQAGRVAYVSAENGALVEHGQVLFVLEQA